MSRAARDDDDLRIFESLRPDLIALAYRMLGDVGRAQDLVQETWLRWHGRGGDVETPRAFLITIVTRLCLNELGSARARLEENEGLRLPEPANIETAGMKGLDRVDQISMAFLVMLERLNPPERAVLLLHEVFDFSHDEIAELVSRSPAACRKLLERARVKVSSGRRMIAASQEEHGRLMHAFVQAALSGDPQQLVGILADEATLFTDGGREGRTIGRVRNLKHPLVGATRIAHFVAATSRNADLAVEQEELNGRPALVFSRDGTIVAALLLEVAEGKIQQLFFQADPSRLRFVGRARHGV